DGTAPDVEDAPRCSNNSIAVRVGRLLRDRLQRPLLAINKESPLLVEPHGVAGLDRPAVHAVGHHRAPFDRELVAGVETGIEIDNNASSLEGTRGGYGD